MNKYLVLGVIISLLLTSFGCMEEKDSKEEIDYSKVFDSLTSLREAQGENVFIYSLYVNAPPNKEKWTIYWFVHYPQDIPQEIKYKYYEEIPITQKTRVKEVETVIEDGIEIKITREYYKEVSLTALYILRGYKWYHLLEMEIENIYLLLANEEGTEYGLYKIDLLDLAKRIGFERHMDAHTNYDETFWNWIEQYKIFDTVWETIPHIEIYDFSCLDIPACDYLIEMIPHDPNCRIITMMYEGSHLTNMCKTIDHETRWYSWYNTWRYIDSPFNMNLLKIYHLPPCCSCCETIYTTVRLYKKIETKEKIYATKFQLIEEIILEGEIWE